jgi:methanogenic corrinoid protein MtbC1
MGKTLENEILEAGQQALIDGDSRTTETAARTALEAGVDVHVRGSLNRIKDMGLDLSM